MKEIWRDIGEIKGIDYTGLYQISNYGQVRSLDRYDNLKHFRKGKILIQQLYTGYLYVSLCKNGKIKMYRVHRLVAEAFIPNPDNLPQVNHINEIKTDNRLENLNLMTPKENINWGTANERRSNSNKGKKRSEEIRRKIGDAERGVYNTKKSKPVLQIDKDTNEIIAEFPSMMEVERQLGIRNQHISHCCKGKRNICGGYKWKYKNG